MGRKKFKYAGDGAFKAFLRRYDCPTPFHVVRMRFVGWVASPALAASPLPIIETLWPGGLPEFEGEPDAAKFFETFAGLIRHVSRYQKGIRVKMAKLPKPREVENLVGAFRIRAEEIRDGFFIGYWGDQEEAQAPEEQGASLQELKEYAAECDEAVAELQALPAGDTKSALAEYGQGLDELTRDAERELSFLVWAAIVLRAADLAGGESGDESW
jgi:hypothetical protein